MKKGIKIALFIAVPVAIAAAVLVYNKTGQNPEGPAAGTSGAPGGGAGRAGGRPVPVNIYVAEYTTLDQGKEAMGTLLANEEVDVASEVAGKVEGIFFEEGARVNQGQVLVKVNDDDLQSQLKRATFQRNLLKEKLERARILLDKDAISRESFDQIETDYNMVEADIQLLEVRIGKTSIKAPFNGVVGFRYVSPGSYIQPGARIAHLVDISRLKVEISLAERFYSNDLIGSEVLFTTQNDQMRHRARIYAVDPVVDEVTRQVIMRAMYDNPAMKLVPGMFVKVIVGHKSGSSIQIPTEAIVPDAADKKVWVVHSGRAHMQSVVTGTRSENMIEVTSGLMPGDSIAITGLMQIKEGAQLTINN